MALSADQRQNASTIIAVGKSKGMTKKDMVTAIATALVESELRNVAYGDRDSLGLFQQRPSMGWGTPAQVQNPSYAAGKFYDTLKTVPGYASLPEGVAAQAVQRSGFPGKYALRVAEARSIVADLYGDAKDSGGGGDSSGDSGESGSSGSGIVGQVSEISDAFKTLSSPEFWKRTGVITLGGFLVILCIIYIVSQSKTAGQVADVAATVATRGASKVVKSVA